MCKLRSESASLFPGVSLLSHMSSVSVTKKKFHLPMHCVGYHVGHGFCGICERYSDLWLQACVVVSCTVFYPNGLMF